MKKKIAKFVPASLFVRAQYAWHFKKLPNLKNPQTFSEKIQWIKLNNRDLLLTKCGDKYEVREYVASKCGDKLLIPLLGVYDAVDEIDFDALPEKFVLKATHGCGWNIICEDKKNLDISATKVKLHRWLNDNYYHWGKQWAYKNMQPRIIAEAFIAGADGSVPPDYKILCFNGEPKYIQVDYGRFGERRKNYYTSEGEFIPLKKQCENMLPPPPLPKELPQMLEYAEKLSKDFDFVRVDLYVSEGKVFFGELTFYPGSGTNTFEPESYDLEFGKTLKLKGVDV